MKSLLRSTLIAAAACFAAACLAASGRTAIYDLVINAKQRGAQ